MTGTTITDANATTSVLQIDAGQTLTLSGVTINDGTINDGTVANTGGPTGGTIAVTGNSTIDSGATLTDGVVNVSAATTLTLDDVTVTGTTFIDTASGAIISIDPTDTLTLSGVTINGGTINDGTGSTLATAATITIAGSSTIKGNAALNNGGVTINAGKTLTLNNVTVTGSTITELNTLSGISPTTGAINVGNSNTLTLAGTDTVTGGLFAIGTSAVSAAGGSVFFSSVGIDELTSGATNPSVTLTIKASSGSFAALSGAGVVVNQSGDTVTLTGLLSAIKAALSGGLTYTPVGTSNTLTLSVDDGSGDTAFRTLSINTSNPLAPTNSITAASGQINNGGLIDVTGTTTLDSVTLLNGTGMVQVEAAGGHLTLDDTRIYGGTIKNLGTRWRSRGPVRSPAAPS